MRWDVFSKFVDVDKLDVDFLKVTTDITSVDRTYGEDVIFHYYRKKGFPHYSIHDLEKYTHSQQLQNFDETTIFKDGKLDQTMHALRLAWSYFPHHWDVRCGNSVSPMEAFNDDDILRKVIRKTWDWVISHQDNNKFTENRFRQNLKVYGASQSVSNFRPTAAKWVYNTYGNDGVVWDMSMGWGGRLLGFLASNCHTYIGTEPSTQTFLGLEGIKKDFEYLNKNVILHNVGSEVFLPNSESLDLCFTSPPYFDTERYSDEGTQSYKKYPTKSDWVDGFLTDTLHNCYSGLKKGGHLLINISNTPTNKWIEDETVRISKKMGFIQLDTFYLVLSSISGNGQKLEPIFVFKK